MNKPLPLAAGKDNNLGLHRVFRHLPDDFAKSLVAGCLSSDSGALNQAIDAAIRVSGFRDASKAPAAQLIQPVLDRTLDGDDRLASALLRTWADSQAQLRAVVEAMLHAEQLPVQPPDYRRKRFLDQWTHEQWRHACDVVLKDREDLDRNEAALMISLASGRLPPADEPIESPLFREWLEKLRELALDAPEWNEADAFSSEVKQLLEANQTERVAGLLEALRSDIHRLQTNFVDELRYLAIDLSDVMHAATEGQRLDVARAFITTLVKKLTGYKPIRPQAPVRDEEEKRALKRGQHEQEILRLVREWEAFKANAAAEAANNARKQEDGAATAADGPPAVPQDVAKLVAERDKAQHEASRLREASNGAKLEKDQLREEISEIRRQLRQSEEDVRYWRGVHVDERSGGNNHAGTPEAPANVIEAIKRAEAAFPNELTFALNSKSHKNPPFQRPGDVFTALAWLATEFRRMRLQPAAGTDFDKSIKEACSGWFYAPNQSDVTMGQNREWYRAVAGGKTWELSCHIGTGTSGDPQNVIRIALAWDEAQRRVVVGYIGPHQRNSQS